MVKKEKEDLILKSLSEGYTNRQIAKIVHCSPNEITRIRRKNTEESIEDSIDMKSKSECSRALDLLQKGVPLIDVIIILDIEPERGKKYQEIYLDLLKREKIVSLLKDGKDIPLKIEILEYLLKNPQFYRKIKQGMDIQTVIWELIEEEKEAQHYLDITNFLLKRAEARLEELNEE